MAFVDLTGASITFQGDSGRIYEVIFKKATSVGFVSFVISSQPIQATEDFWRAPENVKVIDGYISDTINTGDYLDLYINSLYTGIRWLEKKLRIDVSGSRISSPKIRAGSQVSIYHYSA